MSDDQRSVYEMIGGDEPLRRLVDAFYTRVEADALLRPMFPDDLAPGRHYQFLFLTQFFGGEPRYALERGHPRLRMRHFPFPINQAARDRWLAHMLAAIDEVGIGEPARGIMRDYFERASAHMINLDIEFAVVSRRGTGAYVSLSPAAPSLSARIARTFLGLPRLARILAAALFAVSTTLALSPLVDYIYLSYFFHPASVIVPAFVSTALGFGMYVLGWWLTLGVDVHHAPRVRWIVVYLLMGVAGLLLVFALLLTGIATGTTPD